MISDETVSHRTRELSISDEWELFFLAELSEDERQKTTHYNIGNIRRNKKILQKKILKYIFIV